MSSNPTFNLSKFEIILNEGPAVESQTEKFVDLTRKLLSVPKSEVSSKSKKRH